MEVPMEVPITVPMQQEKPQQEREDICSWKMCGQQG